MFFSIKIRIKIDFLPCHSFSHDENRFLVLSFFLPWWVVKEVLIVYFWSFEKEVQYYRSCIRFLLSVKALFEVKKTNCARRKYLDISIPLCTQWSAVYQILASDLLDNYHYYHQDTLTMSGKRRERLLSLSCLPRVFLSSSLKHMSKSSNLSNLKSFYTKQLFCSRISHTCIIK